MGLVSVLTVLSYCKSFFQMGYRLPKLWTKTW